MRSRRLAAPFLAVALAALSLAAAPAAAHNPSTMFPVRWPAYGPGAFQIPAFRFESDFPGRRFRSRVIDAAKKWNAAAQGIQFNWNRHNSLSKSVAQSPCKARRNAIRWDNLAHHVAAITQTCITNYPGYPHTIRWFTTSFDNNKDKWYTRTGHSRDGRYDLESVATHELGHALGSTHYTAKADECANRASQESMCPIHYPATERQRTPGKHDVHTLRRVYPSPVWWADAERPRKHEWANASTQECAATSSSAPDGAAERKTTNVVQGSRVYDIHVADNFTTDPDGSTDTGTRCEVAMDNPGPKNGFPLFHEGDDLWFSWQVYLDPSNFKANWPGGVDPCIASSPKDFQAIAQWKQEGGHGTPALAMGVLSGRFCLDSSADQRDSNQTGDTHNLGPAPLGQWVKFTLHEHLGPEKSGPRAGSIHLCGDLKDGLGWRELVPTTPAWTMKYETNTSTTVPTHQRLGIYRGLNLKGREDIWYDGYTVAASRSAAETNAFGAPVAGSPCSESGGSYRYLP